MALFALLAKTRKTRKTFGPSVFLGPHNANRDAHAMTNANKAGSFHPPPC